MWGGRPQKGRVGRSMLALRYVAFDGDDTLWHNETRFQLTQTALRDLLRRHVPDADVDTHLSEVLEGVEDALRQVGRNHQLLLITKGDLFDQESKLARSGLAEIFSGVEILSEKNIQAHRSVLRRRQIEPGEFVMVGNSLRSDIAPVVALGALGIHIPYPLTWHHELIPEDALPREGWHRLESIKELGALLDSL